MSPNGKDGGILRVFFGGGEFYGQRGFGRDRSRDFDEGETQARTAVCVAAYALRDSPVHRGVRLAGAGWSALARGYARDGRGVHVVCAGTSSLSAAAQRDAVRGRRQVPQTDGAVSGDWIPDGSLYVVGAHCLSNTDLHQSQQHCVHQSSHEQYGGGGSVCHRNMRLAPVLKGQGHGDFRRGESGDSASGDGGEEIRLHFALVCLRGDRERDHSRVLLEESRTKAASVCRDDVVNSQAAWVQSKMTFPVWPEIMASNPS